MLGNPTRRASTETASPVRASVKSQLPWADRILSTLQQRTNLYIDIRVRHCIARLIGNEMLRRTYDQLYFRNAPMWFYFLPRLDVKAEIGVVLDDIRLTRKAMLCRDIAAVGYITRNAISAVLYRLDDQIDEPIAR